MASAVEAAAVCRWDSEELSAALVTTASWRANSETSRPGAPIEESTRGYFLLSKDGVRATSPHLIGRGRTAALCLTSRNGTPSP